MRLADHFDVLLEGTVNLSRFKLDTLDSRVIAIYNALAADEVLGPFVRDKIPQGSWCYAAGFLALWVGVLVVVGVITQGD